MVFATDVGDGVLRNLEENVVANGVAAKVRVRRLDWLATWQAPEAWPSKASDSMQWRDDDRKVLQSSGRVLILAADLIYDNTLTDALLDIVVRWLHWLQGPAEAPPHRDVQLIFSLERRISFCIDSLSARAPAVEHFWRRVHSIFTPARAETPRMRMCTETVSSIPQAFRYERCAELELYRLVAA